MKSDNWSLLFIILILVGMGLFFGYIMGKRSCPEIITDTETTSIVITEHDTLRCTIPQVEIRYDSIFIREGTGDTTTCYAFEKDYEDGAHIGVGICSDSLPPKPADLQANIDYQAPPDTMIETTRIDTVVKEISKPLHKNWKAYAWGIVVGAVAYLLGGR